VQLRLLLCLALSLVASQKLGDFNWVNLGSRKKKTPKLVSHI